MSWVDAMRLRRKADHVRAAGWVNLVVTITYVVFHSGDASEIILPASVWAAFIMALTHGIGWIIDRRADRVVGH
jgi:hypothetical protein